ncbi:MAG: ATP-binding cassette domain-containing protein [Wenzhouxiangellaceae bacterium]|nr:ATP-binding cassette domain-containing protein [Wenzhouxiangellaceae bacterium]
MIAVEHLRKTFDKGRVVAVDDVTFEARDGEITGLLGPNGAGKTTTLRMLYTLLRPDAGSIRIDNVDPTDQPLAIKRRIGVVPDSRGLYDRLTARENIAYYGRLHGLARADIRARIDELAGVLDMGEFIERKTDGFSQGQRVKVAIARALIHRPRTVLLDEPTNGLDVMTTRALREFLRGLKAAGHCVVLSTHIMQEVAALCDRIVIIAAGRIAADGTADQLRARSGCDELEDAFVKLIGSDEGLLA